MKILILTWHFPPSSEIAGKVTFRLVRQLVARGHDVRVVVPTIDTIRSFDRTFNDGTGTDLQIVRIAPWPDVIAVLANLRHRLRPGSAGAETADAPPTSVPAYVAHPKGLHRLLRELRSLPDPANRWIVPARRAVRRLVARDKVDVILSVSPYLSAHLVARSVRRSVPRVRWWAWSHDPASDNSFDLHPNGWRQQHVRRWEASVVRECDGIAVTTEELADDFGQRFGRRPILAGCGFDPGELPPHRDAPANGPMILIHAGTLYGHRTPLPLFEAIASLRGQGVIGPNDVRLRIIGDSTDLGGERLDDAVARLNLAGIVSLERPISQAAVVVAIQDSHAGVVLAEGQPLQVPTKTFDYAGLHRPILALTDGATANLIKRHGLGLVASRGNLEVVLAALFREYQSDHLRALTARVVASARGLTVESQHAPLIAALERAASERTA
jgi:glycosyltransferase involved in cell wall biosynthesis